MTLKGRKALCIELAQEKVKVNQLSDLNIEINSQLNDYKDQFKYLASEKFFKAFKQFRLIRKRYVEQR